MTSTTGFLNCSGFRPDECGLKQIYSPSRLYSLMLPKEINKQLSLTEFFMVNNGSRNINKYSVKDTKQGDNDVKVNAVYWLADFILVGLTQKDECILQTIFLVDHEKKVIVKDIERKHLLTPGKPGDHFKENFKEHIPTVIHQEKEFIAWPGHSDLEHGTFWIFIIPKDPLFKVDIKEYSMKIAPGCRVLFELCNLFKLSAGTHISVDFPAFSHEGRLLCRIGVTENRTSPVADIFGVFVCYKIEEFIDLHGKEDWDHQDVEDIQNGLTSLFFLPRPRNMDFDDFYCFVKCKSATRENQTLLVRTSPEESTIKMCLLNFNTFEYQTIITEKEGFNMFSLHPDGFAILWNQSDAHIQYKKINFTRGSSTLLDITRRNLQLNSAINPLAIPGFKPHVFPGSQHIYHFKDDQSFFKKLFNYIRLVFNL